MDVSISIVIPTYRRTGLLKLCLSMIYHQRFNGIYEVIVVSDGEDEETRLLLSDFSQHPNASFIYTFLSKKSGPAAARNKGWRMAQGELIVFTDDDTQPSAKWLQNYWDAFIISRKSEVAFTGKIKVPLSKKPTDYERNTAHLETADFVTANCACTKVALKKIGGFDEDFTMAWREDSELEFKLMNANIPIIKAEEAVVLHPVRKALWGVSLKEQKKSMFNALLYKKHPQLFRSKVLGSPLWNYYIMIVLLILSVAFFISQWYIVSVLVFSGWLLMEVLFVLKRLRHNSHSFSHICEMLFTSLLIPFSSVYWTLYGAFKFKVFFL